MLCCAFPCARRTRPRSTKNTKFAYGPRGPPEMDHNTRFLRTGAVEFPARGAFFEKFGKNGPNASRHANGHILTQTRGPAPRQNRHARAQTDTHARTPTDTHARTRMRARKRTRKTDNEVAVAINIQHTCGTSVQNYQSVYQQGDGLTAYKFNWPWLHARTRTPARVRPHAYARARTHTARTRTHTHTHKHTSMMHTHTLQRMSTHMDAQTCASNPN